MRRLAARRASLLGGLTRALGAQVFELLTGDLLFDPRAGDGYDRNEDHLAQCCELVGRFPKHLCAQGAHARKYFNRRGELKHISSLRYWSVRDVLADKCERAAPRARACASPLPAPYVRECRAHSLTTRRYSFDAKTAELVSDFVLPLLQLDPAKRATAEQCLDHPFCA